MTTRLTRCLIVTCVLTMGVSVISAAPPQPSPRAQSVDLLFLGEKDPLRLELKIEIDGQSVVDVWDKSFTTLLTYHDRDGNGTLDPTEAASLPSPLALRSILWGQLSTSTDGAPPFAEVDLNSNGHIDGTELADYYRRAGLGSVLVGIGKPGTTEQLTASLLQHLDTNNDSQTDESEWKVSAQSLSALDSNDDELIGPGELVARATYPGAWGSILLRAPSADAKADPIVESLPFIRLPIRLDDTHWMKHLIPPRNITGPQADAGAASTDIRTTAPHPVWQIRLGARKPNEPLLSVESSQLQPAGGLMLTHQNVRLDLRAAEGKLNGHMNAARQRLLGMFAECDSNSDELLSATELGHLKAGQLRHLTSVADKNADGTLAKAEVVAWLELQEQVAKGHVLLTILDHGTGLFEFLDEDHDGSLSVSELRSSAARLKQAGCFTEGHFDRAKLPRQLLATVSHGQPVSMLGKRAISGPEWFQAMDRNQDGSVSRREFSGSVDILNRIDSDNDGLISATEAEQAKF